MNSDTVNLLKECNSGIRMGVSAISRVMPYVKDDKLKTALNASKDEHAVLGDEAHKLLLKYKAETKEPHPIARVMSDMKIRGKLMFSENDKTVASLMTDGCNMGVKSLSKYLNEYKRATNEAKSVANRLIGIEQSLNDQIRQFL